MNEPSLRAEKKMLEELRDDRTGVVRVILAKSDESQYDEHILNFGADEPDTAQLAQAIIDKRIAIIDSILDGRELPAPPGKDGSV